MVQTSLIIGDTNWAVKEDSLLGYNVIQNNYLPIPIDCVRATTATRVNEQGLIEIVPRNLFTYSEDFANAAWTKANVTVSSNVINSPIGTLTADKLVENSANDIHYINGASITFTAGTYTVSIFAKAAERNVLQIFLNGSANVDAYANFNLTTGVVSAFNAATATIQSVGNGWYRCNLTAIIAASIVPSAYFCIQTSTTATRAASYLGDGVSGIFIWGAQLEQGSVATEYFPTTDRLDIPRIDYSTGTASLLVEPQRTNLLTYSEQFNDASWAVNATITPNTTISPDGTQDADTILGTGFIGKNILQSGIHTFSVFAKAGTSNEIRLNVFDGTTDRGVYYNLSNGTITSSYGTIIASNIVLYSNGWYRISITTNNATRSYVQIHMDSAQTCFIWGAQLEAGSYATSYIPTVASSVTRNTDVLGRTGISGLIGQTEGVIFLDCKIYPTDTKRLAISDGTTANAIYFQSDATNRVRFLISQNSATILDTGNFTLANPNAFNKIAFKYKSNDFAIWVNGSEIYSSTAVALSFPVALSKFAFDFSASGLYFFGEVKSTQLYKTALSNTELAQLTTL